MNYDIDTQNLIVNWTAKEFMYYNTMDDHIMDVGLRFLSLMGDRWAHDDVSFVTEADDKYSSILFGDEFEEVTAEMKRAFPGCTDDF